MTPAGYIFHPQLTGKCYLNSSFEDDPLMGCWGHTGIIEQDMSHSGTKVGTSNWSSLVQRADYYRP